MSLINKLKESGESPVPARTTEAQMLDAIVVQQYPEMRKALKSGFSWRQVYAALKEELEAEGKWKGYWSSPRVYSSYLAYRRFKSIEEAARKYENGEFREELEEK